jgi:hypothetical protein
MVLAVWFGCSQQPAIDASSDEALQASFAKLMEGLSKEEADRLNEALKEVMSSSLNDMSGTEARDPAARTERARKAVDGKTASDVLAEADRIKAARTVGSGG